MNSPALPASGSYGRARTGQDGKPEFRFPAKPAAAPERSTLAAAFARRNSNQTGDPKLFSIDSEILRSEPRAHRAGQPEAAPLFTSNSIDQDRLIKCQLVKLLSFSVATKASATGATAGCSMGTIGRSSAICRT